MHCTCHTVTQKEKWWIFTHAFTLLSLTQLLICYYIKCTHAYYCCVLKINWVRFWYVLTHRLPAHINYAYIYQFVWEKNYMQNIFITLFWGLFCWLNHKDRCCMFQVTISQKNKEKLSCSSFLFFSTVYWLGWSKVGM